MSFPIIQQHDDLIQAVEAKELYEYLGLNMAHWSRWSLANIAKNPFALEGTDYGVYTSMVNADGGRPTTNYALSIDFAKKLSMQVRTERGEQLRNYFLECERKTQQPVQQLPTNYIEALEQLSPIKNMPMYCAIYVVWLNRLVIQNWIMNNIK